MRGSNVCVRKALMTCDRQKTGALKTKSSPQLFSRLQNTSVLRIYSENLCIFNHMGHMTIFAEKFYSHMMRNEFFLCDVVEILRTAIPICSTYRYKALITFIFILTIRRRDGKRKNNENELKMSRFKTIWIFVPFGKCLKLFTFI